MTRDETLLLGSQHGDYGSYALRTQRDGATACALSVGATALTSARLFKARQDVPNEDALLAIDEGRLTLMAVADAHFGHEASHFLLHRLAEVARPLPANPIALFETIRSAADPTIDAGRSESTLLVAVWDRDAGTGFGASFGDSTLMILGGGPARPGNRHNHVFVTPADPASLDPRIAEEFSFVTRPGQTVVAFTDGIDSCHYRSPETSIQPHHIQELWDRADNAPERFARDLVELALAGVDGNPGGEDNVAVIAARA